MEPREALEERLDAEYAPAWRPEPGEKLVGEITAISERTGGFGRYPIITVRRDDGSELAIHAFHTVLATRFAEVRPAIGERVGVKYEGKREGASQAYHSYKVAIDRPENPVDWSNYAEDELPEDAPPTEAEARAAVQEAHKPLEQDEIPF